jgi:hypothetical protein
MRAGWWDAQQAVRTAARMVAWKAGRKAGLKAAWLAGEKVEARAGQSVVSKVEVWAGQSVVSKVLLWGPAFLLCTHKMSSTDVTARWRKRQGPYTSGRSPRRMDSQHLSYTYSDPTSIRYLLRSSTRCHFRRQYRACCPRVPNRSYRTWSKMEQL